VLAAYTVKKVSDIPVASKDVTLVSDKKTFYLHRRLSEHLPYYTQELRDIAT